MENKSHALAAGIFLLFVSALLVALAVWLTRDNTEYRVFEISSREGVTGLQPQAGVRYKGVPVGRVTAIGLDPELTGHVLVRIAVNEYAPITPSTFASLGFQGVTGLAFIQLNDSGESKEVLASDAAHPARIPMRPGMFSRLSDQGANLLTQLDEAGQRVNLLLAEQNRKALMEAVANMGQAAASINQLTQRADQMLVQDASETLKSMKATSERLSQSADAVRTSADAFKGMSARMNAPGGTLDKIAQSTDVLVPRLNRAAEETVRTVRQVGRVADTVNENPQSLILGRGAATPGPGEAGFVAPGSR